MLTLDPSQRISAKDALDAEYSGLIHYHAIQRVVEVLWHTLRQQSLYDNSNAGELVEAINRKKKVVVLGIGFLKNLKDPSYDVQVISPRNYFAFTPLLPSVTCGTVESRSVVEPIRNIIRKKHVDGYYWEAECIKIDRCHHDRISGRGIPSHLKRMESNEMIRNLMTIQRTQ